MAEPQDTATLLEDVSEIVQTQYMGEYDEHYNRWGRTTNKLFKPATEIATGNGITAQTEVAPSDTARASDDILSEFHSPDSFEAVTLALRLNQLTPGSNDFTRFDSSAQVSDPDVKNSGRGAIVDLVKRIYNQVMPDFEEKLAIHRHLDRTAQVALVNGTPEANSGHHLSVSTGTATNALGGRVAIDAGSIAALRRGSRIDFVTAATTTKVAGNVRVTDRNTAELTIGFEFVSTGITARQSTGNLASIANNNEIYFAGEQDKGMYSLGAWFSRPAATGDSFIGGVNRQTAANRYLIPTATREGLTEAPLTKSMFDDLAIAMGFQSEDEIGVVFMSDLVMHQRIRNEIGEDSFIQIPTSDARMKRFAHFGNVGLIYQHPTFGVVQITADPLSIPNRVRVIVPETWRTYWAWFRGLQPVRENGGHWYRTNQATPNTGKGLIWKADWYGVLVDWCRKPWMNGEILNIT